MKNDIRQKLMDLIRNNKPLEIEGKKVTLLDVYFENDVTKITFKED